MSRRVGLRLVTGRGEDETQDTLNTGESAQRVDEELEQDETDETDCQPPALGATPAATPSR